MGFTEAELVALLADASKAIDGDISWSEDEDHSPTVEFRAEITSQAGYPLFLRGSYNPLAQTLTFAIIHASSRRIYALDLGKDHHNPTCNNVGEKHKHRWSDQYRDKEAYVPDDITQPATNPVAVWKEFCAEARISHNGVLYPPPAQQRSQFS
ncbi:MAG: DUF6978 family protein [Isosphaeraceae bacterium]